jgi:hypothetical protein
LVNESDDDLHSVQKTAHRLESQLLLITSSFVIQNSTHTIGANLSFKTIKTISKKSEKGSQAGRGFGNTNLPSFLDHVAWDFFEKQNGEYLPKEIHCMVLLESP